MDKENFDKAFIIINIMITLILYAFATRHIGKLLGQEQIIGIIIAAVPSGVSIYYKKQIKDIFIK